METMNFKQKELVKNQDILNKLLLQDKDLDYKKQLAQADAIVQAQKAVDLSRDKLKKGSKANYNALTGAALSMPESIEYEALNIPIADYTEQIDKIKKTLPTFGPECGQCLFECVTNRGMISILNYLPHNFYLSAPIINAPINVVRWVFASGL